MKTPIVQQFFDNISQAGTFFWRRMACALILRDREVLECYSLERSPTVCERLEAIDLLLDQFGYSAQSLGIQRDLRD